MKRYRRQPVPSRRGSVYIPLVAMALLTLLAGLALVLNRIWLDTARVELTTAAESGALAGASQLASDDLLKPNLNHQRHCQQVREAVGDAVSRNFVAGERLRINTEPNQDVRLGHLLFDERTGRVRLVDNDIEPSTVAVTITRLRKTGNPLGMILANALGDASANAVVTAEASVDNRIAGVAPFQGGNVPMLPMAVLLFDPTGKNQNGWHQQINLRLGGDKYRWDEKTRTVQAVADGIPEMILRTKVRGGDTADANVHLLELGNDLEAPALSRQCQDGVGTEDLAEYRGELRIASGQGTLAFDSTAAFPLSLQATLRQLIGEPRIVPLYSQLVPLGEQGYGRVRCGELVAIRILAVRSLDGNACELVVQPCVIATRTALLATGGDLQDNFDLPRNTYIYKLHLTQ